MKLPMLPNGEAAVEVEDDDREEITLRVPSSGSESSTAGADATGEGVTGTGVAGVGVARTGVSLGGMVGAEASVGVGVSVGAGASVGVGATMVGFEAVGSTGCGVLVSWPHAMDIGSNNEQ